MAKKTTKKELFEILGELREGFEVLKTLDLLIDSIQNFIATGRYMNSLEAKNVYTTYYYALKQIGDPRDPTLPDIQEFRSKTRRAAATVVALEAIVNTKTTLHRSAIGVIDKVLGE